MENNQTERRPWCKCYFQSGKGEALLYETVENNAMTIDVVKEPAAFVVTPEEHLIRIVGDDVDIEEVKKEAAKGKNADGFLGTVSKLYCAEMVTKLI